MLRPYHSISECFKARCWDEPPKKEKSENTVASHTDKNQSPYPANDSMTRCCPVSLSTRTQNSLALAGSQFSSMLAVKFAQHTCRALPAAKRCEDCKAIQAGLLFQRYYGIAAVQRSLCAFVCQKSEVYEGNKLLA